MRILKGVLPSIAVATAVAAGSMAFPASAFAASSSISVTTTNVDGGTVTSTSGGTAASKQAWLNNELNKKTATAAPLVRPNYTVSNKELYSSGSTNMAGSYSTVSAATDADVTSGLEEYADFINSSSNAFWEGSSPVNAQQMSPSMEWVVSGLDVSVSVPVGVGFTRSGSSVTWAPGSISNTWQAYMTRTASVHFATPFTFYSDNFHSDCSVLIGNHWYVVVGN